MKTFKVYCEGEHTTKEVSKQWMDGVNTKNAKEFVLTLGRLEVTYKDGAVIYYDDVYGTWGNPTKLV